MPIFGDYEAVVALVLLAGVFAAFVTERFPPEVTASAGAGAFLALGILSTDEALDVLSNPAPVTIAAMFVLSGALVQTGVLGAASTYVLHWATHRPRLATGTVLGGAVTSSAFMNNTPVVMILIPVVLKLARALDQPPSRLLIPLSYAAILGGTCTLIGTSTNLLVDGVARRMDLAPFGLFEITPLGLLLVVICGPLMLVGAHFILPERRTIADVLTNRDAPRYLTEISIPKDSRLIGKTPADIAPLASQNVDLLALRRRGKTRHGNLANAELKANDRLVIAAPMEDLLALHEQRGMKVGRSPDAVPAPDKAVVEALVAPGPTLVGRKLGDIRLSRHDVYPLAVHRYGKLAGKNLDEVRLATGDTILLEGTAEALADLVERADFLNLSAPGERPLRRHKAPIAVAVLVAVVLLAALNVMPIAALAIMGVGIVLVTRCIDGEDALRSVDGRILLLIFAMLIIGRGMEESGALSLMVESAVPLLEEAPPLLVLALLFAMTSILTEAVSNNAVAVVVTPIAAALASQLGLDPRPFVVAVMFAASASFATPIGYQTNTLVYSAGGYRFSDFLRIGIPMNLLAGTVTILGIPLLWPLQP